MTAKEIAVVGFFALLFLGFMGFARGDLDAAYEAKNNAMPQYVEATEWAQVGFRGTFGGDL